MRSRAEEVSHLAKARADALAAAESKHGKESAEAQAARCAVPQGPVAGIVLDLRGGSRLKAGELLDFADWLAEDCIITDLDISWIAMDDPVAMDAMVSALSKNSTLRRLSLCGAGLGPRGAERLGALLPTSRLRSLNLSDNAIGDEGARHIAAGLRGNRSLLELHLWDNAIGDSGAEALADAVRENMRLVELHLVSNKIGDAGARCFASTLRRKGRMLKKLHLTGNEMSTTALDDLKKIDGLDVQA